MTIEAMRILQQLEMTAKEAIAANEKYVQSAGKKDREFIRAAMRHSKANAAHLSACNPGVILRLCEELRKP